MNRRSNLTAGGLVVLLSVLTNPGRSDAGFQLITNGDFENGLAGWTTAVQPGSSGGWFLQSGTLSPQTGFTVQAPPGPTHAAMSDGNLGSQVIFQDFVVPQVANMTAILSFDRYIANQNPPSFFSSQNSLDYNILGNLQARVDLIDPTANPFSTNPADLLLNLFSTRFGDPNVSGYTTQSVDVTTLLAAHSGRTLRLRFAEVNGFQRFGNAPLNFGVDQVSLDVSLVPEPASLALLAFGLL
jgi:hypothetical protein